MDNIFLPIFGLFATSVRNTPISKQLKEKNLVEQAFNLSSELEGRKRPSKPQDENFRP